MKTIFFNNDAKSNQNIQEVKNQLFDIVKNGDPFIFISSDGDCDNWTNNYDCLEKEHDYVEQIEL